ncbi:MAG: peptidyl-prolyl cis-trans isomerase [Bdellovibrionaceae bacterium]|nr:peptidyl-prolyl cis-trans isomerase [Pseudobdellovibrionaceae bacterium]
MLSRCLLGLLILASIQCTNQQASVSNKPVLKVNENVMSVKEFANKLAMRLRELDSLAAKDPNVNSRVKDEIINSFIVRSLMIDWALKRKISVTDSETEAETTRIRALYPDDLAFRRMLAEESTSFADWQANLKLNLLEKKVSAEINKGVVPPTDEEIRVYYVENKVSFRKKERVYVQQIVLKDQARAEYIKQELKKQSFDVLAKKYSIAPESTNGGIVGWIEKDTVDFFSPIFKWPLNQVGEILTSPFGVHVVKITKREPERIPSLEEEKPKIKRRIVELKEKSAYVSWIDKELRSSSVFKDADLISSLKIETRGSQNEKL